jgi:caffeoyl-CoA O-methyltransferase
MILQPQIEGYLEALLPKRPPILAEMEAYAEANHFPIVGPQVGRYLYQMALTIEARRVLELGSGFGYSAFWFALALGEKGRITLTDTSEENLSRAEEHFRRARLESRFKFMVGDALEIARGIDKHFDIVFNDIDKEAYPEALEVAAARLHRGGLFITDNLLWSGRVCNDNPDPATRGVIEFTRRLYADPRFFTTLVPLRDGLAVAIRL